MWIDDVAGEEADGEALLFAAWSGHLFEVRQLLDRATDPDTRDSQGRTALHYAILHDNRPLAECLLQSGANPDAVIGDDGLPALSYAINERRDEIVDLLLEAGASVNPAAGSVTPLMAAVFVRDPLLAQQLLERGADPNAARTLITPLILAIVSSQLDCASVLLQGGADVDGVNSDGTTPLMSAAETAPRKVFQYLLDHGADLRRCDNDGMSVLTWAARGGNCEVAEWLLEQGWPVDTKKEGGYTDLMVAADEGHCAMVELLLRNRAQVNATADNGSTALILAGSRGRTEIVRRLIAAGGKVDHRNGIGRTALMQAALGGHADAVGVLLASGADPRLPDYAYWTAPDIAVESGHAACAALLTPEPKPGNGPRPARPRRSKQRVRPDLFRRLALRGTRAETVHGIGVIVSRSDPSAHQRVARVREALDVIALYDARRYHVVRAHLHRIVVLDLVDGRAAYHVPLQQCELNAGFVDALSTSAQEIALAVVYATTHARLHRRGICARDSAREERLCLKEQLRFAHYLPHSHLRDEQMVRLERQLRFPTWYWGPAARLRQSVRATLPRFPRHIARVMWWYARYLEAGRPI